MQTTLLQYTSWYDVMRSKAMFPTKVVVCTIDQSFWKHFGGEYWHRVAADGLQGVMAVLHLSCARLPLLCSPPHQAHR